MRTIAVTGAASGIGKAVAVMARQRGDRVIGCDRAGADVNADLSTPEGRDKMVRDVTEQCGGTLDALIACAGVPTGLPPEVIVGVNYFGTVDPLLGLRDILARSAAPRVVVTATEVMFIGSHRTIIDACLAGDEPGAAAAAAAVKDYIYHSVKKALALWVKREAVAKAWGGSGIVMNGVAPGVVATPMARPWIESAEGQASLAKSSPTATGKPGEPEDLAELMLYLASEHNRFVVGQTIYCDGGAEAILRPEHV